MKEKGRKEQIVVRITGVDRPGLTASVMSILAKYDAMILDIGQADIHNSLSLGVMFRIDEQNSGHVMEGTAVQGNGTWSEHRFRAHQRR